jgi:hypothetical protein
MFGLGYKVVGDNWKVWTTPDKQVRTSPGASTTGILFTKESSDHR